MPGFSRHRSANLTTPQSNPPPRLPPRAHAGIISSSPRPSDEVEKEKARQPRCNPHNRTAAIREWGTGEGDFNGRARSMDAVESGLISLIVQQAQR
jgi:hypothetical protein